MTIVFSLLFGSSFAFADCAGFHEMLRQWAGSTSFREFVSHRQSWMTQELKEALLRQRFEKLSYEKKGACRWSVSTGSKSYEVALDPFVSMTINGQTIDLTVWKTLEQTLREFKSGGKPTAFNELILPEARAKDRFSHVPSPAIFATQGRGATVCQGANQCPANFQQEPQAPAVSLRPSSRPLCTFDRADISFKSGEESFIVGFSCTAGHAPARAEAVPRGELDAVQRRLERSRQRPSTDPWGGVRESSGHQ